MHFFHFYLCSSICFAFNFFCVIFYETFSTDLKSAYSIFSGNFVLSLFALFANFKAKCIQNGFKKTKTQSQIL
jgi:hypothetical protein